MGVGDLGVAGTVRSLENRELRHYLARAGVWSVEPLSHAPRAELLTLARTHIARL